MEKWAVVSKKRKARRRLLFEKPSSFFTSFMLMRWANVKRQLAHFQSKRRWAAEEHENRGARAVGSRHGTGDRVQLRAHVRQGVTTGMVLGAYWFKSHLPFG